MYLFNTVRKEHPRQSGQGLVEYALILVMVAVVVIIILTQLGPGIGNIFCEIVTELNEEQPQLCIRGSNENIDVILITRADYKLKDGKFKLHIDATSISDGNFNSGETLIVSPKGDSNDGAMKEKDIGQSNEHYHLDIALSGCPCTVTITSSLGGTATVTVG